MFLIHKKKLILKLRFFVLTIIFTQLFIRGAGYFNGGFMICLAIIFVTLFLKNSNEKKLFINFSVFSCNNMSWFNC